MIAKEILDIVNDSNDDGEGLNLIVDQFRSGRPVQDLLQLLESDNQELIGIGAWIAGEMEIDGQAIQLLLPRLQELLNHEVPSIRFQAFNALFPILNPDDDNTRLLIERMCQDANEGVRTVAESAFKRIYGICNNDKEA